MNLLNRFTSPTPKFWKKVMGLGATLSIIGGAILAIEFDVPVFLEKAAGYILAVGATLTAIGQFAIDPDKIKKEN